MDADQPTGVAERLDFVRGRIAAACRLANRPLESVRLVAVTKGFDADVIRPALIAGQTEIGENRVQEAKSKWTALREEYPSVTLHLIGPLQSNKAADAVAMADVLHTIDREKIAAAIAGEIARQKRAPRLLVQVNTGGEPQKAGIAPEEADRFVARCRDVHGMTVDGLMCIPPVNEPPAPHFGLLATIAKRLGLRELSMGMSEDFETAIALGATMVRVGSAIFGRRQT